MRSPKIAVVTTVDSGIPLFIRPHAGALKKVYEVANTLPQVCGNDLVLYLEEHNKVIVIEKLTNNTNHFPKINLTNIGSQIALSFGRALFSLSQEEINLASVDTSRLAIDSTKVEFNFTSIYLQSLANPLECVSPKITVNPGYGNVPTN